MARCGAKWSVDNSLLVIGYGNTLRRDDGVGPGVADAVERLKLQGVQTVVCTQLTPELADPLSRAGAAVFVDASVGKARRLRMRRLDPSDAPQILAHASDPRDLLGLARKVYGRAPDAWMLTIPVEDLGFGDKLSENAGLSLRKAVRAVRAFHRRLRSRR